jgi:hypothetical protein
MIEEHVTIQEPFEFLFVGAVMRFKECIGKRIVKFVVRGCQPTVEEVSDFYWLGMFPIIRRSMQGSGFVILSIAIRHKSLDNNFPQ